MSSIGSAAVVARIKKVNEERQRASSLLPASWEMYANANADSRACQRRVPTAPPTSSSGLAGASRFG
jgi:hypothetical protein